MTVSDLIREKRSDAGIREDLGTVLREAGARETRVLNPEMELTSHLTSAIVILVDFEPGRTLLDLVSLEGELELLLGYRVNLLTKASSAARSLAGEIERSVPLNA